MLPLSTLLLQRGVATLADVEAAMARQVVFGGDLVTNLLEVAAVDESKLVEVVADCEGARPAPAGPLPEPEPDALRVVPADVARGLPFLPMRVVSETLVVAVPEPIAPSVEQELSFTLGLKIEQKLTTRARVVQALARAYQQRIDRRFERIVARLDGQQDPWPTDLPPPPLGESLLPPQLSHGPAAVSAASEASPWLESGTALADEEGSLSSPPAAEEPLASPSPEPSRAVQLSPALLRSVQDRDKRAAQAKQRNRRGPFTLVAARDALESASSHAAAINVLFDFAKQFFEYTALFVVRGDLAEGMDAAGPGASRARIRGVGVPLEMPSVLATARDRKTHVLSVPSSDGIDGFLRQDLQRPMNARVLTVPLAVRSRVVALLYGDDGEVDVDLNLVGDVLALAPLAGAALEQLILRRKLEGRTSSMPPSPTGSAVSEPSEEHAAAPAPDKKRETLRGLQALGGARLEDVEPMPLVAPYPSREPETMPGPPGLRPATSPFSGAVDTDHVAQPGVSPAAKSVRGDAVDVHDFDEDGARDPSVSPAARSVRSDGTGVPISPDTVIGLAPATPVDAQPRATSTDAASPAPSDIPEALASGPTLLSTPTDDEDQEPAEQEAADGEPSEREAAEQEPTEQEAAEEQSSEQEAAEQESATDDDAPELSVGEVDEDDDMVEAVLAELQKTPPPEGAHAPEPEPELEEAPPSDGAVVQEPMAPPKSQSPSDVGLPLVILNVGGEIEEMLDQLEAKGTTEEEAERLRNELRSFGQACVEPVLARFPGRVLESVDPTRSDMPNVVECGPLLRFVVEQGQWTAPLLRARMAHADPEVRLWVVLALAEIGGKEAREALCLGLFDFDAHVRHASRMTLRGVVGTRAWANAVRTLVRRAAVDEKDASRMLLAIEALGQIREASSVPILIDALRSDDEEIRVAAEAGLHEVTRCVLSGGADAWEAWWKDHAQHARFEWLVEALERDDEQQRRAALRELREIVGKDLGFDPEDSEEARAGVIQAYRDWWEDDEGRGPKRKR